MARPQISDLSSLRASLAASCVTSTHDLQLGIACDFNLGWNSIYPNLQACRLMCL